MPEITTITPFISKETSKDWNKDCEMLEQTIHSVMAMSPKFIQSIVVGHDRPPFSGDNPRIRFIKATHNPPGKNNSKLEKLEDKAAKIVLGIRAAHDSGNRWAMYLDADDLVSIRLESLCDLNNHDAIVLSGGYLWDQNTNILRRSYRIHKSCGSTYLIRLDPRWFPYWLGNAVDGPRVADQSHPDIHDALVNAGARIQRIHSPTVAYRVGSDNSWSGIKIEKPSIFSIKFIKDLVLLRRPSKSILNEFSMPRQ